MKNTIAVATYNAHKLVEIQAMLGEGYKVVTCADIIQNHQPAEEDGSSFNENATLKVRHLPPLEHVTYLGDDSGLEVTVLANRPGIFSARYGGDTLTDKQRCYALLEELREHQQREARFVCVMALKMPNTDIITVRGEIKGQISTDYHGENGFGYDPIFIPEGYAKSFAQITPHEKNHISHRYKALKQVKEHLER